MIYDLDTRVFDQANLNLRGLFLFGHFWKIILKKELKIGHTKIVLTDLNFPRQELFNNGLGFVVALLVCRKIHFSRAYSGRAIQL